MTQVSSLTALTGAGVDTAADLLPIVDMSLAGTARNKKITIDEFIIALNIPERARDALGAALVAGTNVTITPNDGADTITIDAAGGGSLDVEDEGVSEATGVTVLNFIGAGVSAVDAGGGQVDITIAGGGGGIDVEDEGVSEATGATILNFTGSGVTATDVGGGQVDIAISGGGTPSGTSFPGSPSTDDKFYRTDRRIEYFYDGTRWLSTQILLIHFSYDASVSADTAIYSPIPFKGLYDIYLERLDIAGFRSASGEWDFLLQTGTGAGTYVTIATVDGSGHPTTTWFAGNASVNAVVSSSVEVLRLNLDEVSGSASLLGAGSLSFRLVG